MLIFTFILLSQGLLTKQPHSWGILSLLVEEKKFRWGQGKKPTNNSPKFISFPLCAVEKRDYLFSHILYLLKKFQALKPY